MTAIKTKLKYTAKKLFYGLARVFYPPKYLRHHRVGPMKYWKRSRSFQIKFLKDMNLQPYHYLLDIGCGTLRGGIPIIKHLDKGHYFGIEVRKAIIEEARKELKEEDLEAKEPELILSESLALLELNRRFDYIWAFSVLIHLEDAILSEALCFVRKHLSPEGFFYANVNMDSKPDSIWSEGFPIVRRSLEFYKKACALNGLQCQDIGLLIDFNFCDSKGKASRQKQNHHHMLKFWIA
jgi:SAM-dependent methyltransferase